MGSGNQAHPVEMDKEQQRRFYVLCYETAAALRVERPLWQSVMLLLRGAQVPSVCPAGLLSPFSDTGRRVSTSPQCRLLSSAASASVPSEHPAARGWCLDSMILKVSFNQNDSVIL